MRPLYESPFLCTMKKDGDTAGGFAKQSADLLAQEGGFFIIIYLSQRHIDVCVHPCLFLKFHHYGRL